MGDFQLAPDALIGGRYRLVRVLGAGGMGVVWEAVHVVTHRAVALKFLKSQGLDAEARRRFVQEARAACAVEHPGLVPVHDVLESEGGDPALVMDLLRGESLRVRLARETRLELGAVARIGIAVCSAVGAAHAAGIVHRDLKPENIFLTTDGAIRVLDFGVAKVTRLDASTAAAAGTQSGLLLGTPRYMSPEQVFGDSDVDLRADVWSLGLVLYECLTGVLPTALDEVGQILKMILTRPMPALASTGIEVPVEISALVDRMLSRDRQHRPASLGEVAAVLAKVAGVEAPMAGNAQTPTKLRVDGGALSTAPTESAEAIRTTTAKGDRRSSLGRRVAGAVAVVALVGGLGALATLLPARGSAVAPSASASGAPSSRPVAMTDFPPPASRSPEALAAYAAGLQAYREAAYLVAVRHLEQAIKLDPGLGAAHARLAVWHFGDIGAARRSLETANGLLATLSARDRALVVGLGRCVLVETIPVEGCTAAVRRWEEEFPDDAELHFLAGWVLGWIDIDEATRAEERAVALDPGFAMAWSYVGWYHEYRGESGDAAFERCLALSSRATDCLLMRVMTRNGRGDCAGALADARTIVAANGQDGQGHHMVAENLASLDAPLLAVEEALRQKATSSLQDNVLGTSERATVETTDRIALLLLQGDFRAASALAEELDGAKGAGEVEHAFAAHTQIQAALELQDDKRAAAIAQRFDARRAGWNRDPLIDDFAMERDATPLTLRAARRGGRLSGAEMAAKRQAWIDDWRHRTSPYYSRWLWSFGYARVVDTPEDAREAVRALEAYGPIPPFMPATLLPAYIGHTYLLADRVDDALPYLRRATRSCFALHWAIEHTRAHVWLGQALEKKGDKAGACGAYEVVMKRWGERGQPSKSLATARARMAALACDKR